MSFEFTVSGSTRVLNYAEIPVEYESPIAGTSPTVSHRFERSLLIPEEGTITQRAIGLELGWNAASATSRIVLDWLRFEHEIEKASMKLKAATELDSDAFAAEVKRIRGKRNPLSAAAIKNLRDEHTRTIQPARIQSAEAWQLEQQLSDLVIEAYGLAGSESLAKNSRSGFLRFGAVVLPKMQSKVRYFAM